MLQQVHLQYCLFPAHRPHGELLHPDNAEVIFLFIRRKGGLLHASCESILPQSSGKTRLILADLAFNRGHRRVNGGEHIGSAFLCPEPGACTVNGQLHIVPVLFRRKDDKCLRILLKIPCQLHYLFLGISMDIARQFDFLLTKLELHTRHSFRITGLPVYYYYTTILVIRQGLSPRPPKVPPWSARKHFLPSARKDGPNGSPAAGRGPSAPWSSSYPFHHPGT